MRSGLRHMVTDFLRKAGKILAGQSSADQDDGGIDQAVDRNQCVRQSQRRFVHPPIDASIERCALLVGEQLGQIEARCFQVLGEPR